MYNSKRFFLLLAALAAFALPARAQYPIGFEKLCPEPGIVGLYSPFLPLVLTDPLTGKNRADGCYDNAGNLLLQPDAGGSVANGTQISVNGQFNVKNYGAVGDAKMTHTAVTTGASAGITDATATPWLATDVGKLIYCVYTPTGVSDLTTVISTIATVVSPSSITITGGNTTQNASGIYCVWFTQKETASFVAAFNAAKAALPSFDPESSSPTLAHPSAVYCPPGGYVLDGQWYNQVGVGGDVNAIGFQGAGRSSCDLYISPDFTAGAGGGLMYTNQAVGLLWTGFKIEGAGFLGTWTTSLLQVTNNLHFHLLDFDINDMATTTANIGALSTTSDVNGEIENIHIQNNVSPGASALNAYVCSNSNSVSIIQPLFSNYFQNLIASSCGSRLPLFGAVTIVGGLIDECANGYCTYLQSGSVFNATGSTFWEPNAFAAILLDATSSFFGSQVACGPYNPSGAGTVYCISGAAGSFAEFTASTLWGSGAGTAVTGPAGFIFVDGGGNSICHGLAGACTPVSVANYASQAYSGGVVPYSSLTHTPNTCVLAITWQATTAAAPICNPFVDQNSLILHIKASSTTVTTCATAPVVTVSDGTNSATLTLTTGKSSWDSSVDASTGVQTAVFTKGNTITVSNTIGVCATPPTNFALTYTLESVLSN
jgi:hypothetical protein